MIYTGFMSLMRLDNNRVHWSHITDIIQLISNNNDPIILWHLACNHLYILSILLFIPDRQSSRDNTFQAFSTQLFSQNSITNKPFIRLVIIRLVNTEEGWSTLSVARTDFANAVAAIPNTQFGRFTT